jgi:hypothetical protein
MLCITQIKVQVKAPSFYNNLLSGSHGNYINLFQQWCSNDLKWGPHLVSIPPSLNIIILGTKLSSHEPLGDTLRPCPNNNTTIDPMIYKKRNRNYYKETIEVRKVLLYFQEWGNKLNSKFIDYFIESNKVLNHMILGHILPYTLGRSFFMWV